MVKYISKKHEIRESEDEGDLRRRKAAEEMERARRREVADEWRGMVDELRRELDEVKKSQRTSERREAECQRVNLRLTARVEVMEGMLRDHGFPVPKPWEVGSGSHTPLPPED